MMRLPNVLRQRSKLRDLEAEETAGENGKGDLSAFRTTSWSSMSARRKILGWNIAGSRKWIVRITILLLLCLIIWKEFWWSPSLHHSAVLSHRVCATKEFGYNASFVPSVAFQPAEVTDYRAPDVTDAFSNYLYRNHTNCQISSLDLHGPFAPLCSSRPSMLEAISGGGRIGFDAPFMPRACDMRWFSTEEICEIFGRFERVIVVGDSMMRHVVGALNVLLRKDLGYGAVTNWNFSPKERRECFCNKQFDVKECSLQGIYKTADVLLNDPPSLACDQTTYPIDLVIEMMLKFPLDPVEVDRFKALLSLTKPKKPYAFIFGHGLWNDLDLQATVNWLDGILDHTRTAAPYLDTSSSLWPRLFVTPNAAGVLKPDQWVVSQGDKALQIFEQSVMIEAAERGVEHLGTWNMSIQSAKFDGVHLDLKGNLIKAMAIVNWLAMTEVERW